ncbi:LysM receptor kinase K1B, partial [Trifolium medium]|nr:LysM receptor kinase K1B [Trifolium medium]
MKSKVGDILRHDTDTIQNRESEVYVPFPCDCINGEFLGHTFLYELQVADFYDSMSCFTLSNMTTEDWLDEWTERNNVNVTVNCSCGNRGVSKDYGLFITYTLR